jgi:2,3-bisphosphoglycerate-dependent phosphoglycerate mutase
LRHLKSQWNKDNRFAGWVDNPLSDEGRAQAAEIANILQREKIDVAYTSPLIRNQETALRIFETFKDIYPIFLHLDGGKMQTWAHFEGGGNYLPVYVSEKLNERYYGNIQGLNKEEIARKYGERVVRGWRRGFSNKPPGGESLEDTYKRVLPFFKKYIAKDLTDGKNVLVVTSGNSLRAVVKYIANMSDEDMMNFELPFGALTKYEFDGKNFTKN